MYVSITRKLITLAAGIIQHKKAILKPLKDEEDHKALIFGRQTKIPFFEPDLFEGLIPFYIGNIAGGQLITWAEHHTAKVP